MTHGPPTPEMREAFSAAVSSAIDASPLNPPKIADALGVSHDAVRKWAKIGMVPDPLTVFGLEVLLGLPPGELSRHLGYRPVDSGVSVVDAIGADPNLNDTARKMLLGAYQQVAGN